MHLHHISENQILPWYVTVAYIQPLWMWLFSLPIVFFRVGCNPIGNKQHLQFLAFSAWNPDKPMPLGDPYYTFKDFLLFTGLIGLGFSQLAIQDTDFLTSHIDTPFQNPWLVLLDVTMIVSVMSMTIPYVLRNVLVSVDSLPLLFVNLFLIPLTFYPHQNIHLAYLVLLVLYNTCEYGIKLNLRKFQWESPYYNQNPIKDLRQAVQKSGMIDSHWHNLSFHIKDQRWPIHNKLIGALIFSWWAMAISQTIAPDISRKPDDHVIITLIIIGLAVLHSLPSLVRFMNLTPMQFGARLLTLRWFIPRFDLILLRPALMLAFSFIMVGMFEDQVLTFSQTVFATTIGWVLISHYTPPSIVKWQYSSMKSMGKNIRKFKIESNQAQTD